MLNKKISVLFLAIMLFFGLCACGDNNFTADDSVGTETQEVIEAEETETEIPIPVTEREVKQTVTIKADPDGTPVSAKLKTSGEDMEEEVDVKDLPFGVKIRYFLEEKEVSADAIKGATGNVRIRFDYENKAETEVTVDGHTVRTKVPFAFISMMTVPEDRLYNVEVNSGDVTEASGSTLIYGYAVPGLEDELKLSAVKDKIRSLSDEVEFDGDGIPEYLEIKGYAVDFDMDFTATLVTNGFLKDTESEDLNDISDAIGELGEFSDAGNELSDGVGKLKDGAGKFGEGLGKYVEGAGTLKDGAEALSGGVSQLKDGASALSEGTSGLNDGLAALDLNSQALKDGASGLSNGLGALLEAYTASQSGGEETTPEIDPEAAAENIAESTRAGVLEAFVGNETLTEEEKMAIAEAAGSAAYEKALAEISEIKDQTSSGTEQTGADLTGMIQGLYDASLGLSEGISSYAGGVSQLAEGAAGLKEGVSQLSDGLGQLAGGASELSKGAGTLASSGKELTTGYSSLESGIGSLKSGVDEINSEIFSKIGSLSYGALPETLDKLKAMRLADKGFTAWNTYDGEEGGIVFILETE